MASRKSVSRDLHRDLPNLLLAATRAIPRGAARQAAHLTVSKGQTEQ
jgi:hypothetical protein